jgi:hypothetical protein
MSRYRRNKLEPHGNWEKVERAILGLDVSKLNRPSVPLAILYVKPAAGWIQPATEQREEHISSSSESPPTKGENRQPGDRYGELLSSRKPKIATVA